MTRTDTDPHADEQDSPRCICWDDPDDESDRFCQHCADRLDENYRRDHERAVAKAWDQAHAEDAARQARPHDSPGTGGGSRAAAPSPTAGRPYRAGQQASRSPAAKTIPWP